MLKFQHAFWLQHQRSTFFRWFCSTVQSVASYTIQTMTHISPHLQLAMTCAISILIITTGLYTDLLQNVNYGSMLSDTEWNNYIQSSNNYNNPSRFGSISNTNLIRNRSKYIESSNKISYRHKMTNDFEFLHAQTWCIYLRFQKM